MFYVMSNKYFLEIGKPSIRVSIVLSGLTKGNILFRGENVIMSEGFTDLLNLHCLIRFGFRKNGFPNSENTT